MVFNPERREMGLSWYDEGGISNLLNGFPELPGAVRGE